MMVSSFFAGSNRHGCVLCWRFEQSDLIRGIRAMVSKSLHHGSFGVDSFSALARSSRKDSHAHCHADPFLYHLYYYGRRYNHRQLLFGFCWSRLVFLCWVLP
ncbi:hypothetical protein COOONC_19862 [Cooperia oncophora]